MKKSEQKSKTKSSNTAKKLKKAEAKVYDEKKLFHIVTEQSLDILLLINRESIITYANAETEKVLGLKKEEIIGSYMYKYIHPDDYKLVTDMFNDFFEDMKSSVRKAEIRIFNRDGNWHTVEAMGTNIIYDNAVQAVIVNLRDINERKKTEEALRKSEAFYRLVTDNITEHVWIMDLNLQLIYISPSVEKIYGYTVDEIKKLKLKQLLTTESFQKMLELFSTEIPQAMVNPPPPSGTRRVLELQARHKNGHLVWIENRLSFIRDENGKPVSIMGETRDITERKKAEELLYKSEGKYRNILEDIKEGYFEVDLAGKFTFFNDTVCRVLGYSMEELMGMDSRQYTNEAELKKVSQAYDKIYKTGEPCRDLSWQITRKDGTKRDIEGYISLRKDSSGKPIGFRGIAHDITERKQIEERLRDEERRFRALADQSSDIIILVNNKGNITYENKASEVLGLNAEERIGSNVFERLHPDDLKLVTDSFNILFSDTNAPIQKAEIRLRHMDGSWHTFEAIGNNLVRDNVVESAIVNLRDITERKKAQELLKLSEEKYRLLADHMKDQVWTMDLNMNITYVSPSVERLTGYSLDEIKKQHWEKLLTPESLQKATDFLSTALPKALKASSNYLLYKTMELEFILKGGQTVWGECAFSLIRDETGKAVSILGEARNIAERKLAEEKLQNTLEMLKKAVGTTIQVLVSALEARDPYTSGHQSRSANLACAIATEMGLDKDKIEGINMAGIIHDIGKLSIPAEILSKPTKLTNLEFSLIKVHPQSGYEMLKDVESPWPLAEIVHQHHERMNGTGYPRNIRGDEIIIEARIMAVADVVEAMASHRPYRASLGMEAAINEIEKNRGTLYDEAVVDACLRLFREKGYKLT